MVTTGFISYEVDNDRQFRDALDQAIKDVGDLRFPMGEISRDIFKNTKKNFILKGSGQYPPLTPKYAAYKKKKAGFAPILVGVKSKGGISGRLRDSVIGFGSSDTFLNIGKQSLVQGTKVPYSRFVQEGTKKMPVRKFLFIDKPQLGRIQRTIGAYVVSKLEVLNSGN